MLTTNFQRIMLGNGPRECSAGAGRESDEHNSQPLTDPRARLYLNDTRNHLLLAADGAYDVVSSEPSNPWLTG